jgi:hypothetical protein
MFLPLASQAQGCVFYSQFTIRDLRLFVWALVTDSKIPDAASIIIPVLMKNKDQASAQTEARKPAKAAFSDAEFRRRLKNISEWRKKRLAQLRAKDSR